MELQDFFSEAKYLLNEVRLRANLNLIRSVAQEADVEIILALKAFALWKTFPIFKEYISSATASSVAEALLVYDEMQVKPHVFTPAYTEKNIEYYRSIASHIVFNSLSQAEQFLRCNDGIAYGLRINPEYSPVETELYKPTAKGSRFGVPRNELPKKLPLGITGLHCHNLCESSSYDLEKTLFVLEEKFDSYLNQVSWLNLGGGHLMTRSDYNVRHLIDCLKNFKQKYPHLHIILEPGSAFAWRTGELYAHVVDLVNHHGISTAILDVSFTCHMPDCLEMPYKPIIRGAYQEPQEGMPTYRMGGCSCLSGDYIGDWSFQNPLKIGDEILFEDMIHYTTVKTNMFNGVAHPDIWMRQMNGEEVLLRRFTPLDYKERMD